MIERRKKEAENERNMARRISLEQAAKEEKTFKNLSAVLSQAHSRLETLLFLIIFNI